MPNRILIGAATLGTLLFALFGMAGAAGSASAGAVVFEEECGECHTVTGKHKKGPTLRGIVGRKAGTAPGFNDYSDPVKNSNLTWTAEELDKYLTRPKQFSPSIKMKYDGLPDAKARADLIEFLASKK